MDIEYLKGSNKRKGILTLWHSWKQEGSSTYGSQFSIMYDLDTMPYPCRIGYEKDLL